MKASLGVYAEISVIGLIFACSHEKFYPAFIMHSSQDPKWKMISKSAFDFPGYSN